MFKVAGVGNTCTPSSVEISKNTLYNGNSHKEYVYIDLGKVTGYEALDYLSEIKDKPIYFRFLVNMVGNTNTQYDFVTGYFEINNPSDATIVDFPGDDHRYLVLKWKMLDRDGGTNPNKDVNPVSKAGWGFGRKYLNRIVYSMGGESNNSNFSSIVQDLVGSIEAITELWKGPNKALQDKGCAKTFVPHKSWVRLQCPGNKLGGGIRVKKVTINDNWNLMTEDSQISDQEYGQVYDYTLDGTHSSGVASYEPNMSPENPLVEPFYPKTGNYQDKLVAPKDQNYFEKPFGAEYFPSPKVTYSKVTVKNLPREEENLVVSKHATGYTTTSFYTTKDFPTISNYTDIDLAFDKNLPIANFLNVFSINHLAATQGFSVEINDMDGQKKSEFHFDEGGNSISGSEYRYKLGQDGKLDNTVPTIDSKGVISEKLIGVQYDVINDFNESKSQSSSLGSDINVAGMIFGIFPFILPIGLPRVSYNENILRTAVTTKVVSRSGILSEVVVHDLNSTVSTKNEAWDAASGNVILTRTTNEFDDNIYKLDYPAYWYYNNMGLASQNIDLAGKLEHIASSGLNRRGFKLKSPTLEAGQKIEEVFKLGDELIIPVPVAGEYSEAPGEADPNGEFLPAVPDSFTRAWVAGYQKSAGVIVGISLIKRDGRLVDPCVQEAELPFKIVRSGRRNLQSTAMASITTLKNPIRNNSGALLANIDADSFVYGPSDANGMVIDANAVEYSDFWNRSWQKDNIVKQYPKPVTSGIDSEGNLTGSSTYGSNPYVYNIKGDWRAVKSYAYLAGRNSVGGDRANPRVSGFFNRFGPFYRRHTDNSSWVINAANWTNASKVTQYSYYGMEEENQDALLRYSSVQYGYNNTLPVAVASNSMLGQMGAESFEDGYFNSHFSFSTTNTAIAPENFGISSEQAHTGRKSMKIPSGEHVQLARILKQAPNPGLDFYVCQDEPQEVNRPQCPGERGQTISRNPSTNYYEFTFTVDYGADSPSATQPYIFCNTSATGYQMIGNTITYSSLSAPLSTYVVLKDANGDCMAFDIVCQPVAQFSDTYDITIRGCVDTCLCQ